MYTLYARAGWGSALIETQLAWYGLPYRLEGVGDLFKEEAAGEKLRPVNPLMQLPTLVLPDGQVMTESAAITLYLAEATGRSDLVPPPPRPQFLRWLVFVIANIYPTHTYADVPGRFVAGEEAQKAFRGQRQRLRAAALGDNGGAGRRALVSRCALHGARPVHCGHDEMAAETCVVQDAGAAPARHCLGSGGGPSNCGGLVAKLSG